MIELNAVYCEENLITLGRMPDNFIDLTVTSPPYDDLDENLEPTKKRARDYKGHTWEFKPLVKELFRVTKDGGVVAWVVADRTVKGSETGTVFRQALYFMKCGFNLHDTMIYAKKSVGASGSRYCYSQAFEYMFVFSKGKIKTSNLIRDVQSDYDKQTYSVGSRMNQKGINANRVRKKSPKSSKRTNVWYYNIGFQNNDDRTEHPAVFPEKLAEDHILSWSNPGEIVYDPFAGSGTTAKMSVRNNRYYIASEPSREYCDIIEQRLATL